MMPVNLDSTGKADEHARAAEILLEQATLETPALIATAEVHASLAVFYELKSRRFA